MAIGRLWFLVLCVGVQILWCCDAVVAQEASIQGLRTATNSIMLPMGNVNPINAVPIQDLLLKKRNITVMNEVICAIHSSKSQATFFVFKDEVCSMMGPDLDTNSDSLIYRTTSYPDPKLLEDVAFGKPTFASIDPNSVFTSDHAVDGDDASLFSSGAQTQPWWILDFGNDATIYQIQILPRQGYEIQFKDVEFRIGDKFDWDGGFTTFTLLHFYEGPCTSAEGRLVFFLLNKPHGRYLSIQVTTGLATDVLHLKDVKVFALRN